MQSGDETKHKSKFMGYTDNQELLQKVLITTCKNNTFIYQKWLQILYHHHQQYRNEMIKTFLFITEVFMNCFL